MKNRNIKIVTNAGVLFQQVNFHNLIHFVLIYLVDYVYIFVILAELYHTVHFAICDSSRDVRILMSQYNSILPSY
jgi:hypothetical protein